jgi:hypothetical protein
MFYAALLCVTCSQDPVAVKGPEASNPRWQYVVPPAGSAQRRPPLRAVPLATQRPEELTVGFEFAGDWQRFALIRYGDPDSNRVAVVLDHGSPTTADLYVDLNRDLYLAPEERVQLASAGVWELSLPVATRDAEGGPLFVPRRIALELGGTGTILGMATLGWLEGVVQVGEETLSARRRDGDANGFFSDPSDQLWLDRDGDGGWDSLKELYVVQPIVTLGAGRFALRSSRLGADLTLSKLEGTGRVRLSLPSATGVAREDLVEAQVLLVGRDGSATLARAPGDPTEIPVGDYRIGMITLQLKDASGRQPWSYVFSETSKAPQDAWHAVLKDAELMVDPIGALDFRFEFFGGDDGISPGAGFSGRPILTASKRLLINTVYRGHVAPSFGMGESQASIALIDPSGRVLFEARSGFA